MKIVDWQVNIGRCQNVELFIWTLDEECCAQLLGSILKNWIVRPDNEMPRHRLELIIQPSIASGRLHNTIELYEQRVTQWSIDC